MRKIFFLLYALQIACCLQAQVDSTAAAIAEPSPLRLNKAVDFTVTGVAGAWTLYSLSKVSNKDHSTAEAVQALHKDDINWFDRWGVKPVSNSADKLSYVPFYVAMPLPLGVFLIDKKMRKDFFKLTLLYAEAMTSTGVLYGSATRYVDRYRPFVYTSESPLDQRVAGSAKNSFFAGHVALVGTSAFFIASTYDAYHPHSPLKWVFYGGAAALTATTGYLRHQAGMHFPSDILLGTAVGTLSGILVPHFHKVKPGKDHISHISILPYSGGPSTYGIVFRYKV
ncbi:MAG: phosphatase PAP2 family protein [Chitinophagaceae bacterium]